MLPFIRSALIDVRGVCTKNKRVYIYIYIYIYMKAGLYGVQKFHRISGVFKEKNWKETKLRGPCEDGIVKCEKKK